jgi:protocatechuate 3,4-dioxygenase beta subunit
MGAQRGSLLAVAIASGVVAAALAGVANPAAAETCRPTSATQATQPRNPHYKPGAPVRSVIGKGHVPTGVVRSTTCVPVARARIELFQAGPNGRYSNGVTSWANRATLFTRRDGSYRFESAFPTSYGGNSPHIHLHVTADGFRPLEVTYFAVEGATGGRLDLVLVPDGQERNPSRAAGVGGA